MFTAMRNPVGETPGWFATAMLSKSDQSFAAWRGSGSPHLRPFSWIAKTACKADYIPCPVAGQVRISREEVGHDLLASGFIPLACILSQNRDTWVVSQYFRDAFHAGYVCRVAWEAFDQDDLAFAAQFVGQPLR
jgi:hypothetical protein